MRVKPLTLGVIAIAGAVALGAGSQAWITFSLDGNTGEQSTGHDLNAALSPIAIAIVAAALALSIAGPVFRRVLGVLVAGLGGGVAALAAIVIADPEAALTARVTELTGLAGHAGFAAVSSESLTVWSWVTLAAGVIAALAGLFVAVASGRWGTAGRKYESSSAKSPARSHDRISDWDSLSDGDDPTDDDGRGDSDGDDASPGTARA